MNFKEMTLLQLKAYAKEKGIRGVSMLKKDQLIERLTAGFSLDFLNIFYTSLCFFVPKNIAIHMSVHFLNYFAFVLIKFSIISTLIKCENSLSMHIYKYHFKSIGKSKDYN